MNNRRRRQRVVELLDDLDNNLGTELKRIKSAMSHVQQRADNTPDDQYLQEMFVLSEQGRRIAAR